MPGHVYRPVRPLVLIYNIMGKSMLLTRKDTHSFGVNNAIKTSIAVLLLYSRRIVNINDDATPGQRYNKSKSRKISLKMYLKNLLTNFVINNNNNKDINKHQVAIATSKVLI